MRRRLFNFATGVSLLLFVAVGVLWVRSLRHFELAGAEYTGWPRSDRIYLAFGQISWYSDTVGLMVITEYVTPAHFRDPSATWFTVSPAENPTGWRRWAAGDRTTMYMNGYPHGFHFQHHVWTPVLGLRRDTWIMGVRPWLPMALLAVMPAMWLERRRAAHRARRLGLCAGCGYDLRGTPHRCPECGAMPVAGPFAA
jgi:hypothetical protein